jgi:iron-sulfur cluster repair protein YtfE (RIC family)
VHRAKRPPWAWRRRSLGTTVETPTQPDGRLSAFGNQLIEVHIWLREQLTALREDVDSYLDGHGERPGDLRAHCLMLCSAVSRHHTGEDDEAFPVLAGQFPQLEPVIAELRRDHQAVVAIMDRLDELLAGLPTTPDPVRASRVRAELDGLAALLESHFVYEEKRLVAALNSIGAGLLPPSAFAVG